jgi:hypothetical protein
MGKRSQIKSDEVIDDSDDTGDDAPAPAAKKAKKEARQPAAVRPRFSRAHPGRLALMLAVSPPRSRTTRQLRGS